MKSFFLLFFMLLLLLGIEKDTSAQNIKDSFYENDSTCCDSKRYVKGHKEKIYYYFKDSLSTLRCKRTRLKGKVHGITKFYTTLGKLSLKVKFKNGLRHGAIRSYTFITKNGTTKRKTLYLGKFKNGQKHGIFKNYLYFEHFNYRRFLERRTLFINGESRRGITRQPAW